MKQRDHYSRVKELVNKQLAEIKEIKAAHKAELDKLRAIITAVDDDARENEKAARADHAEIERLDGLLCANGIAH